MVSCCGQSKDQPGVDMNGKPFPGAGPGIIDSQPTPTYQPVLNYNNNFQPPSVPSPPPIAHQDRNPFLNGVPEPMREFRATSPSQQAIYQGQPSFQQSTITGTTYNGQAPMRAFSESFPPQQQTPLPTFSGSTYNGSNFNSIKQSITRPTPSHVTPQSPTPQDEGKMSISIDFGVYPRVTTLHSLILVQAQHSRVL